MELHLKHRYGNEVLRLAGTGSALTVVRGEESPIEVELVGSGPDSVLVARSGVRHRVRFFRDGTLLYLHLRGRVLRLQLEDPDEELVSDPSQLSPVLRSPMPGKILEVLAEAGATVVAGQPMVRMEAMKMEIDVPAQMDGTISSVSVAVGDLVDPDAELLRIESGDGD